MYCKATIYSLYHPANRIGQNITGSLRNVKLLASDSTRVEIPKVLSMKHCKRNLNGYICWH